VLGHYFKIALRNLVKNGVYSIINLLSLSLAIACAFALSIYVRQQLTFDMHHENHASIVRVVNEITTAGQSSRYALTSRSLGPLLSKLYPQIGSFVRVRNFAIPRAVFRYKEDARYWDNVKIADPNIFSVFTHEAVYGNLDGSLADPSSIVVSETFARSYFGNRNPVGETISTDTYDYRVTAVYKDLPRSSHLRYDALLSTKRLRDFGLDDESASPEQLFDIENYTYFLLRPGMDLKSFELLLQRFRDEYVAPVGQKIGSRLSYVAQPLTDIHFQSDYRYDQPVGNILYVYGFLAVAAFLVIVACINYTNLATARAIRRSKEIGMRRVIGATQAQLITQFLGESVVLALVAAVLGVGLLVVGDSLIGLDRLLGAGLDLKDLWRPAVLVSVLLAAVLVGLAAGFYPALYLSSISAKAAITNQRDMRKSKFGLREALVLVQFLVSIGIVASTIVMYQQLRYVADKPLGFDRENRLAIVMRGVDAIQKIPLIKAELERQSDIASVTDTSFVPGDEVAATLMMAESDSGNMQEVTVNQIMVGRDFVKSLGIGLASGRDFSERLLTDVGTAVLVNESLVRQMGWNNPIGKRIQVDGRVIGVVKDFHFSSLHTRVGPMVVRQFRDDDLSGIPANQRNLVTRTIVVVVKGARMPSTIAKIREVVSALDPKHPFEYRHFEDLLEQQYADESRIMRLTGSFAAICIFISCLGLYGLAAFTTEQRTKEIGIRRVLGATRWSIILLLSRSMLALVAVAAVGASLATYLMMERWLQTFEYRDSMHFSVFVVSSLLIACLAFLSVALQAARASGQNPAHALRYE
jgi:putative ABC transport system permease protein